jgi:hypothetical protein
VSKSKPRRKTLQHELNLIHGFHNPACCSARQPGDLGLVLDVAVSEDFAVWARVADAWGARITEGCQDKQETPEVGPSKVSTDRTLADREHGGCSPERRR